MSLISKLLELLGFKRAAPDSNTRPMGESPMTEGDFHSGPGGYSGGSGYSDTFYGDEGDYR